VGDRLDQQRLARLEVVHEGALRDSGALGDASGRERAVAALGEALDRGIDQREARGVALLGAGEAGRFGGGCGFTDHVIDDHANVPSPIARSAEFADRKRG